MPLPLTIVIVVLVLLLIIGAPVIFAIGSAGIAYFFIKPDMLASLHIYVHRLFTGMDSFVFLCIPLFILSGELMASTGMMERLVKFCRILVGRFKGGLAYVNVLVSMLFGGISGSGLADVSALGPIEIKMMVEDGYSPEFSSALTATSAIQGPIIPPSIPLVIFASLTQVSVGALFLAGAIPGIMIGIGQITVIRMMSKRRNFPHSTEKASFKETVYVTKAAFFALLMPIIILGGILTGVFTATEAAAVAAGYSFFVATIIYKTMNFNILKTVLIRTARTTASIYLIVAFTSVISWILAMERVPTLLSGVVASYDLSPYVFLFIVNIFFLINGMWISDVAQLILFAPIFTPLFASMGIHPIHFGVVMVVNIMISMITPPYGLALYLSSAISKAKLSSIVRETIPFTVVSILVLFTVSFFPRLVLFLPQIMGFYK